VKQSFPTKMRPVSNANESIILAELYRRLYRHYGPQRWWPGDTRLEIIVGAILTQNTAWANVEKAIRNLKAAGLLSSARRLHHINKRSLARLIKPAGYYNVKSSRIKNFTRFLFSKYGGSLERMARRSTEELSRELIGLNGIGPETRDSILLYAFKRPVFVVDAYTKRILSRHGMVKTDAFYDEIQGLFMSHLSANEKMFNEYHALIVRLGKERCRTSPQCYGCVLGAGKVLENRPM